MCFAEDAGKIWDNRVKNVKYNYFIVWQLNTQKKEAKIKI
jgi:hypothetical protein